MLLLYIYAPWCFRSEMVWSIFRRPQRGLCVLTTNTMNSRVWTRTYFCEWSLKQQTTLPPWKQTTIKEKQPSRASSWVLCQQGHLSIYDIKIKLICYSLYWKLNHSTSRISLRRPRQRSQSGDKTAETVVRNLTFGWTKKLSFWSTCTFLWDLCCLATESHLGPEENTIVGLKTVTHTQKSTILTEQQRKNHFTSIHSEFVAFGHYIH